MVDFINDPRNVYVFEPLHMRKSTIYKPCGVSSLTAIKLVIVYDVLREEKDAVLKDMQSLNTFVSVTVHAELKTLFQKFCYTNAEVVFVYES